MAEAKVVIGDKEGKSYQTTTELASLINKKIGDKISSLPNFSGYEFEITGGSDNAGFPMRKDAEGPGRRRLLLTSGPGVHIKRKGMKERKTVRGNAISLDTAQINLKVITQGKKSLKEMLGKKEGEAAEEKPKEEPKEAPKKEPSKEKA